MSVAETGETDEFEIDHSKSQLIAHYQALGYEDVKVEAEKKDVADREVLVTFTIEEGPQRVVKSIDFEGNAHFSDKTLKEQMLTQEESFSHRGVFLKPLFEQDLETITSFYQKDGFLDTKVEDWKRSLNATQDKYLININLGEGKQTLVEKLKFEGLSRFTPNELRRILLVKESKPYSASRLEEDVRALLIYYSDHAHPYAEVKTELEEVSPQKVNIVYKINEGPETKVGKILLVGDVVTQRNTILDALRFKEGGPFIPKHILQSQTNLRKLGIFDALTLETLGLKGKEEIVHVVIRVEEKKRKVIDLGISYDTDTSLKAKLIFSRLNLGGWGKRIDLKLTAGIQIDRAEIAYVDPRFFGSDWQFLANVFAQYENRPFFTDFQVGLSAGYLRELTRRLSLLIKYEFSRTDFVESKTDFNFLKPGSSDNTTGELQFDVTYDHRDNYGDPRKGYFVEGRTDFGTRFQGGGLANFFKLDTKLGYWYSPFPRLTIANAFRTDTIFQISGVNIPTQELIFYGGDDTIRGFEEDALNPNGGKVGFIYNLEFQLRLFKGFEGVAFLDTASLTNTVSEINLSTIRHSAGAGIRYVTPVGPIRLEYGIILDRQPGENFGRVHFTFGYFF